MEIIQKPLNEKDLDVNDENKPLVFPTVITGGKTPTDDNWLITLTPKTKFLCKTKNIPATHPLDLVFEEFTLIVNHANIAVLLLDELNEDTFVWVDPLKFSRSKILIHVLKEGTDE